MNHGNVPTWYMEEVWARDDINEWWWTLHYDPDGHILTNIRVGDLFTLGKDNQFGLVSRRVLNVGANIDAYYSYEIAGDIGGHWRYPKHEWFQGMRDSKEGMVMANVGYVRFIPNATQLMEIANVIRDDWFGEMAGKLMTHYNRNPFQKTHKHSLWKIGI